MGYRVVDFIVYCVEEGGSFVYSRLGYQWSIYKGDRLQGLSGVISFIWFRWQLVVEYLNEGCRVLVQMGEFGNARFWVRLFVVITQIVLLVSSCCRVGIQRQSLVFEERVLCRGIGKECDVFIYLFIQFSFILIKFSVVDMILDWQFLNIRLRRYFLGSLLKYLDFWGFV